MTEQTLSYYLERYAADLITPQERSELQRLMQDPANTEIIQRIMDAEWPYIEQSDQEFPEGIARLHKAVAGGIRQEKQPVASVSPATPVHRIHFIYRWRWAAAIVILLGVSAYFYTTGRQERPSISQVRPQPEDILPGSDKALLTLADGTVITLDSAANGAIAQQGNSSVIKLANGMIRYDVKGPSPGEEIMMNTMRTPRGGQYKLVLPDGTRVWLNAASSITYPSLFAGTDRKVKITGEVYMEVAADKAKPFLIDVDGKTTVQVLGTSFNINAYADEDNIRTTLIEGSVQVINQSNTGHSVILRPGQQAIVSSGLPFKVADPDIEEVLAWKNGVFNFNGRSFYSFMKDIERWYDVDVKYEGVVPAFGMKGEMDRGVKLSGLMRFIETYGLNVRLEGRALIVKTK